MTAALGPMLATYAVVRMFHGETVSRIDSIEEFPLPLKPLKAHSLASPRFGMSPALSFLNS
jgi:hypothetical protein